MYIQRSLTIYDKEISKSTFGAASELLAATDLIQNGFDVFRNLSPNGPCDLIAMKDGVLLRIEVKSAPHTKEYWYDVLAVVSQKDGTVKYSPDITDWATYDFVRAQYKPPIRWKPTVG